MGYGAWKRKILRSIDKKWKCVGYFGYGQGRAVAEFGEDGMRGKSACLDICKYLEVCNRRHHVRMDAMYPQLAAITAQAFKTARENGTDIVAGVVDAMARAAELDVEEAVAVKATLKTFGVETMTDHYRAGQLENIQIGFDERPARQ